MSAEQQPPDAEQIMQALGFTLDDLQANQGGQIGVQQIAYLRSLQTRTLLIGMAVFISFALLATILLFFGQRSDALVLTLAGIFVTVLNAISTGLFGRQWMRLATDVRDAQVETLDGIMERVVRAEGKMNNFVLRIAGAQFEVKKELFRLFRHEVPYRVYRAPHSGTLLGAEAVMH